MQPSRIPFANPRAQYEAHARPIQEAVLRVLESGYYILGEEVSRFERAFADFVGAAHCVGVANGTEALALALLAVGVRPGDEVITVSQTAVATVAAVEQIGAVPVFADIDPATRCMDPEAAARLVSPRTRALLPVHLYGQPAPMPALLALARRHGLKVVEDCAQAHGAALAGRKVGTFGDAAAFSFYPTKNLGAIGDGGAVVTGDADVATYLREVRQYGWRDRYVSAFPGLNSRLDELQAAILNVKLPSLERDNARRREIARRYAAAAPAGLTPPRLGLEGVVHAMHLYVVETDARDALAAFLGHRGIGTGIHYPLPVHLQPAYSGRIRGGDALPHTERLAERILSLPMYPELSDEAVDQVCVALHEWASLQRNPPCATTAPISTATI